MFPNQHTRTIMLQTDIEDVIDQTVIRTRAEKPLDNSTGVSGERLRSFIKRIEKLEEDKAAVGEDLKEVYSEAKGTGFDTKIMKKIVSIRKMDRDSRIEEETILDLYLAALGMS